MAFRVSEWSILRMMIMPFKLLHALAAATALLAATASAAAQSAGEPPPRLRVTPPASNPHDVFRQLVPAAGTVGTSARPLAQADCPCPMMSRQPAS